MTPLHDAIGQWVRCADECCWVFGRLNYTRADGTEIDGILVGVLEPSASGAAMRLLLLREDQAVSPHLHYREVPYPIDSPVWQEWPAGRSIRLAEALVDGDMWLLPARVLLP